MELTYGICRRYSTIVPKNIIKKINSINGNISFDLFVNLLFLIIFFLNIEIDHQINDTL